MGTEQTLKCAPARARGRAAPPGAGGLRRGALRLLVLLLAVLLVPAALPAKKRRSRSTDDSIVHATALLEILPRALPNGTEIVLKASSPFTYTTYEAEGGILVIEMPGVELGELAGEVPIDSAEVSGLMLLPPAGTVMRGVARLELYRGERGGAAQVFVTPSDFRLVRIWVARLPQDDVEAGGDEEFRRAAEAFASGGARPADERAAVPPPPTGGPAPAEPPPPPRVTMEILEEEAVEPVPPPRKQAREITVEVLEPSPREPVETMPPEPPPPAPGRAPAREPERAPPPQPPPLPQASGPVLRFRGIQVVPHPQGVVLQLEISGNPRHSVYEMYEPPRLVLNLMGVAQEMRGSRFRVREGGVEEVRLNEFGSVMDPVTRVLVELSFPAAYAVAMHDRGLRLFVAPGGDDDLARMLASFPASPGQTLGRAGALGRGGAEQVAGEWIDGEFHPAPVGRAPERIDDPWDEARVAAPVRTAPPARSAPSAPPAPPARSAPPAPPAPVDPEPETPPQLPGWDEGPLQLEEEMNRLWPNPLPSAPEPDSDVEELFTWDDLDALVKGREQGREPELLSTEPRGEFQARVIGGTETVYVGRPISLDLKEAPLQEVFRFFHEISGLNFVVDPAVADKSITLDVNKIPWDQLLDLILKTHQLGKVMDGNVLRIAPLSRLRAEETELRAYQEAEDQSGQLLTMIQTLSYARAEEAQNILRQFLSARGDIIVDSRTNQIIVEDVPKKLREVQALIRRLDVPTKQVVIEARIVEVQKNFQQAFGIQWGFNFLADREHGNTTDYAFPNNIMVNGSAVTGGGVNGPLGGYAVNLPVPGFNSAIGLSLGNLLDTFRLDLAIMALESKGKARIISSPRVVAQNNQSATIESGVQLPIVSTTEAEIDVRFVPASLRLIVTPQITADGTVLLDMVVENNSPSAVVNVQGVPGITTRRVQTAILVQDGGTAVLGGIFQVNEGVSTSRVPGMHRVPLLGWMFKNRSRVTDNNELLVFVTPRIIE